MRILITAGFLGHFGETDGVVTTYRNLLPHFAESGLTADVVAYGREDRCETSGSLRVFVHRPRFPLRVDSIRRVDLAFATTRLARELAGTPYSIIQSSTPDPLGLWARRVARRRDCPFLALFHTALAEYTTIRAQRAAGRLAGCLLGKAMASWLDAYFNGADLVLAPSQDMRNRLAQYLRPAVGVLGRGVDSQLYHPGKRTREDGPARALYVGRIAPEKNLDLLVRAFARHPEVELMIVGDGPYLRELKGWLPHATFPGRLEGEALARAYADADFFVFPSLTDTLGNVVLEAMASGLPALVMDRLGPKELVRQGETGFVAHTDDEFASAVHTLATDAQLRRTMGQAARRQAEARSWGDIFSQLLGHYERLLAGRRPAALSATPRTAIPAPLPLTTGPLAAGTRTAARAAGRPLCVLDVTEFFGETSGGVKTYLTQKAEYVAERPGLRAVLVVPGAENRQLERRGVRWYELRGPRIPKQRPYRLMFNGPALRQIIERERPDLIELGSNFIAPWLVTRAVRASGTPVVWFCHSNLERILAPYPATTHWFRRWLAALSRGYMRSLSRLCAATLAACDTTARDLEGLGARNVQRVSLGVDLDSFNPARRALALETRRRLNLPEGLLVLFAGRLTPEKGLDVVLEAWPAIERATGAHLALVGDASGAEKSRLSCTASNLHWLPYESDRERLAELMAAADLFLAPSPVETFGLAAVEALACDTPVLSNDVGAVAEHVHRSGAGAVFASGSPAQLAQRAIELLTGQTPVPSGAGREYVTRSFSWTAAFDRIFGVYQQILARS